MALMPPKDDRDCCLAPALMRLAHGEEGNATSQLGVSSYSLLKPRQDVALPLSDSLRLEIFFSGGQS